MAKNFYAVRKGLAPGIYENWDEAKAQVTGFAGAEYKGFMTREEAESYMNGESPEGAFTGEKLQTPYAFVDGSYNIDTGVYGCGGFLIDENNERHIIQDSGNDSEMAAMRNVAGEILGATLAVEKALELGLTKLTIYYDYEGIAKWALGSWKRNKTGTEEYARFIESVRDRIDLTFIHVKGHSGIPGNEEADRMAKDAVGIE
ncbi:MAG: ribonuclease H family protein [Lachnospiraceae bacterium]|nr:ribonuclease H family protein [Lachnospiraceae bacterium]